MAPVPPKAPVVPLPVAPKPPVVPVATEEKAAAPLIGSSNDACPKVWLRVWVRVRLRLRV